MSSWLEHFPWMGFVAGWLGIMIFSEWNEHLPKGLLIGGAFGLAVYTTIWYVAWCL